MINLLPPKEKQELSLRANKNLTIVIGSVILISLLSLVLVLFSVKFYILSELTQHEYILYETEKAYQTPEFLALKEAIEKSNKNISTVQNFYKNQLSFANALKNISSILLPEGLYLTSIHTEPMQTAKSVKVTIAGVSNNRDSLINFQEALETNTKIKNLYLPAENWIKPANFNFFITFEYAD